jgi:hypothetical protein
MARMSMVPQARQVEVRPGPVPPEHLPGVYANFLSATATFDEIAVDCWVFGSQPTPEPGAEADQVVSHQVRILVPWRVVPSLIEALSKGFQTAEQMKQLIAQQEKAKQL